MSPTRLSTAVMSNDDSPLEEFWRSFVAATGLEGSYTAWGFGNDAEMADSLSRLVRDGPKRATTSLLSSYEDDDEPLPKEGELSIVLGGGGEPICVIRTISIEVRPFGQVDEHFAWTEGEGGPKPGVLASRARPILRKRESAGRRRHCGRPGDVRVAVVTD